MPSTPRSPSSRLSPSAGAHDEILHENERTLVVRRRLPGGAGTVVLKRAIGSEAIRRLRHERSMLERVASVDGTAKLAAGSWGDDVLALQDDEGISLGSALDGGALPLEQVLRIGAALSRVMAEVHRAGVIHKDINPSNILLCGPERRPVLIDFNISTALAEERKQFGAERQIAGTLAYMPPEQTGRTGQPIDSRADLYALGAVLFCMVTGKPPFEHDDMLDALHHQLTSVPPPLTQVKANTPHRLSDLVARLLEKDPGRRYQSADGVAHDLERLLHAGEQAQHETFALGERDFAARLMPPSTPVGRRREIAALEAALAAAMRNDGICMFITGPAGVGKTALVNELLPTLAEAQGWFVSGQFDAHRQDAPSAIVQAMRDVGRLLLSEPEEELAAQRERICQTLGVNIASGLATLPEFETLLGKQPTSGADPAEAEKQSIRAAIDIIRCVASRERPLVMLLDDLQWAPDASVRFVDAVIAARGELPGFLLLLAGRPQDISTESLLGGHLAQWAALDAAPLQLKLGNLNLSAVNELVGQMLRLPQAEAAKLGAALSERARGNPQDTIELVNALRADGLLVPGATGWRWDEPSIRRFVGDNEGVDLLDRRIGRLSVPCLSLLEAMACLSGDVSQTLLERVHGDAGDELLQVLAPALEDGLLVAETKSDGMTLRLRNHRVRECLHARLVSTGRKAKAHLMLASRLAPHADCAGLAAQQYIEVLDDLVDPAECRRAVALLCLAADTMMAADSAVCERYAGEAVRALQNIETADDAPLMLALLQKHHLALYALGRHQEADVVYEAIAQRCADPLQLAEAAGVQVHGLTNRCRFGEAMTLGLQVLECLGISRPQDVESSVAQGLRELVEWTRSDPLKTDLGRAEATDPKLLTLARFIKRVQAPAFNEHKPTYAWLLIQAHRLWRENGPCLALMSSVGSVPFLLATALSDFRAAYAASRHAIAIGDARGYEPAASVARIMSAMCATHWCEPLEEVLNQSYAARSNLMKAGDTQYATYTFSMATVCHMEMGTLDNASLEVDAELAFAEATGNSSYTVVALVLRQLMRALRGETGSTGSFNDGEFDEAEFLGRTTGMVAVARGNFHVLRALSAAIYGDHAAMREHADAALVAQQTTPGYYVTVHTCLLRGLGLAERMRSEALGAAPKAALADELRGCRDWLAARAVDAPANFMHLAKWLDAELAWSLGDSWAAGAAFEAALSETEQRKRPWHRALTLEHAARFYFAHGWERTGRPLLADALRGYDEWGASGKVRALVQEFPFLRSAAATRGPRAAGSSTIVSSDMVDMMAILRASQALSSETSLSQLNARVAKVLGAMCGAESVLLLVQPREMAGWYLATSLEQGNEPVTLEQAAADGMLPLSAFRYAERTREALLLDDATRDRRFASDPALAGLAHCSMLIVPILKQGEMQAMLMLENRARQGAFSTDRLDSISLIAGQLAVSLDNALLYSALERKVAERTAALEEANKQLEQLSVTDALTGLANRRHFNQALELEWNRARRSGSSVGIAMIDIDEFKQYNDHYGHQGGDACLKLVADAMSSELRIGVDMLARYGGEEFVLLLRDSDLATTHRVAERVREAVAAKFEPHVKSQHRIVTISLGISACLPAQGIDSAHCLHMADLALYQAKRGGRNRVASGGASEPEKSDVWY